MSDITFVADIVVSEDLILYMCLVWIWPLVGPLYSLLGGRCSVSGGVHTAHVDVDRTISRCENGISMGKLPVRLRRLAMYVGWWHHEKEVLYMASLKFAMCNGQWGREKRNIMYR